MYYILDIVPTFQTSTPHLITPEKNLEILKIDQEQPRLLKCIAMKISVNIKNFKGGEVFKYRTVKTFQPHTF